MLHKHKLSVEELLEINDFYNSSTRITITYCYCHSKMTDS